MLGAKGTLQSGWGVSMHQIVRMPPVSRAVKGVNSQPVIDSIDLGAQAVNASGSALDSLHISCLALPDKEVAEETSQGDTQ